MKKLIKLFIIIFLLISIFQIRAFAQTKYQIECSGILQPENNIMATVGGLFKPSSNLPGEYFRALIVFAEFQSDNNVIDNWPKGQLPDWAYNLTDSIPSSSYRPYSLSDYFKKMSVGDFDFIGDVFPRIITLSDNIEYSITNQQVIDTLNIYIQDFKRYDNWKLVNGVFQFSPRNGDGYLDMLIIVYRWALTDWFDLAGGIARLGNFGNKITHDGVIINSNFGSTGSGITINCKARWYDSFSMTQFIGHEYGHYLFGGYHSAVSGIMPGDPYDYNGCTFAMSAWERERLGYIALLNSYNGYTRTLRDYVTTGDAIRVNISTTEYFIIENHQRLSPYDQIIRGGTLQGELDPNAQLGKGIYIWYIKSGDSYPPNVWALTADGSWNWKFIQWDTLYGWNTPPPIVPILDRDSRNIYLPNLLNTSYYGEAGHGDRNTFLQYNYQGIFRYSHRWHDKNSITGDWEISRDVMGDETDAFNIGYNELLTPWSNPSTTKYISGNLIPTDISIQLVSQTNNNITIRIYNTYQNSLNLPPAKPQNLKVQKSSNNHPLLTWDANIEPDLSSYKIYKKVTEENGWQYLTTTTSTSYEDLTEKYLPPGQQGLTHYVYYKITAIDNQSKESVASDEIRTKVKGAFLEKETSDNEFVNDTKPTEYLLQQNYPNPFNPSTTISYALPQISDVEIVIYDIMGKEVKRFIIPSQSGGYQNVVWDGRDEFGVSVSSGIYIYRFRANSLEDKNKSFEKTAKFILLK